MGTIVEIVERSTDWLHPIARPKFINLAAQLRRDYDDGVCEHDFRIFETYRSPARQDYVNRQGNSKAQAFRSAHQFGLACDFVPYLVGRGYYWDHVDWEHLRKRAHAFGFLNDIPWDRAHVEHPLWKEIQTVQLYWKPQTPSEGGVAA